LPRTTFGTTRRRSKPWGCGSRPFPLTKGIHVAGVPRLEQGPHDLDVLLRHRLLPQPDGFEGKLPTGEEMLSADPSVCEPREHGADLHSHWEGGTFGLSGELKEGNHRGSSVMELAKIEPEIVEVSPSTAA
jgi:hypothetical protein